MMLSHRSRVALWCVLVVATAGHAAAPPPESSILIGAYYVPYPSSGGAYLYQYIADAGIEAIVAVSNDPGDHLLFKDYNTQVACLSNAAQTSPALWVILQRQDLVGEYRGTFEADTPNMSDVNGAMDTTAFVTAGNLHGWNTWDEPSSAYSPLSSRLDSLIRLTIEDLGADSTWTTHVGWFRPDDEAGMRRMLELLDGHDGVGWGRRPVFGAECHHPRNLHPAHEFNTTGHNRSAPVSAS